jgi:transposase
MAFIRKIKKGGAVYLAEVENVRVNGKVKQKHIRYVGKEINGEAVKRVASSSIEIKDVKQHLDYFILHKIAEKLGLTDALGKEMQQILLLVYTQIVAHKSIYKLPEYVEHTSLKELLGVDKIADKNLYLALDQLDDLEFGAVENIILDKLYELDSEKKALILDVTDTYFSGSQADWKKRRGKDGKVDKLVQIALAVTQKNGFPIMHKFYEGNISNIMVFKDLIADIRLKDFDVVIVDRGMMCSESVADLQALKQPIITGLKSSQKIFRAYLQDADRNLMYRPQNRVKLKKTTVYARSFDHGGGKLIAVFNPEIELSEREKAMELNRFDPEKAKYYGYSLIFHTTNFTTEEVIRKYFEDKDIVEKAYRELKSPINLNPIRHYRLNRVRAHTKICYLAYSILAYMNFKLKPTGLSAVEALDKLKYGYKIKLSSKEENFEWQKIVTLTKQQLDIINALDCSV